MGSEDPERAPERAERKRKERSASAEAGRERKRDKKDKKERRSKDKKEKKDRRDKAQKQHEGRDGHDEDDAKAAAELKAKLMMPVEDGEIDAEDGEIAEAGSVRAEWGAPCLRSNPGTLQLLPYSDSSRQSLTGTIENLHLRRSPAFRFSGAEALGSTTLAKSGVVVVLASIPRIRTSLIGVPTAWAWLRIQCKQLDVFHRANVVSRNLHYTALARPPFECICHECVRARYWCGF
jgi:hypothetical protein